MEKEWPITINTVVHKNNIKGIYDLQEWVGDRFKWHVNILTYPKHLMISESQKQTLVKEFNQHFDYMI